MFRWKCVEQESLDGKFRVVENRTQRAHNALVSAASVAAVSINETPIAEARRLDRNSASDFEPFLNRSQLVARAYVELPARVRSSAEHIELDCDLLRAQLITTDRPA